MGKKMGKSNPPAQGKGKQRSLKATSASKGSLFKVMIGTLVVIVSSMVSLSLSLGLLSTLFTNNHLSGQHAMSSELRFNSGLTRVTQTEGVNPVTQLTHRNAKMFAEARDTNNQVQGNQKKSSSIDKNSFKNIGSTQYVMHEEANELVSLDAMMHVNTVHDDHSHGSFESQTRSTVPEYDAPGSKDTSYHYYYYDSVSQSFHLHQEFTTFPDKPVPLVTVPSYQQSLALSGRYRPSICKDGYTYGYSDWQTLQKAVHELGDAYSMAVQHWEDYNAALSEYEMIRFLHYQSGSSLESPGQEYAQKADVQPPPPLPGYMLDFLELSPDPFEICPKASLRPPMHGRQTAITVNAEDVVIQCDSCIINSPGTHFAFGPHAKNVHLRGLTLMGATASSVIFRHDGAEVSFEDCFWANNDGIGMNGAVADMNSTR